MSNDLTLNDQYDLESKIGDTESSPMAVDQQTTATTSKMNSTEPLGKLSRAGSSNPAALRQNIGFEKISFDAWCKKGKPPVVDKPFEQRIKNILRSMKKVKNDQGKIVRIYFDKLPDQKKFPEYYRIIPKPLSLDIIRSRIRQKMYNNLDEFISDLTLMFHNAKTYYPPNSQMISDTFFYEQQVHEIIAKEMEIPNSEYLIKDKSRTILKSVEKNSKVYKVGDWVLIYNPNDINKPIVGQIFLLWKDIPSNQVWMNVNWYYRPEQTIHRSDRLFYPNEVIKSNQYRDHLVEEIVADCFVSFITRYQRSNPLIQYDGPAFVCEYRYTDSDKSFNKIRSWKYSMPDEVKNLDDFYISLRHLRSLHKLESPLKYMLPADAAPSDPIPAQPTLGHPNAPPIIGMVYLRPVDLKDESHQFSSTPNTKYISDETLEILQKQVPNGSIICEALITLANNSGTDSPGPGGSPIYATSSLLQTDSSNPQPINFTDTTILKRFKKLISALGNNTPLLASNNTTLKGSSLIENSVTNSNGTTTTIINDTALSASSSGNTNNNEYQPSMSTIGRITPNKSANYNFTNNANKTGYIRPPAPSSEYLIAQQQYNRHQQKQLQMQKQQQQNQMIQPVKINNNRFCSSNNEYLLNTYPHLAADNVSIRIGEIIDTAYYTYELLKVMETKLLNSEFDGSYLVESLKKSLVDKYNNHFLWFNSPPAFISNKITPTLNKYLISGYNGKNESQATNSEGDDSKNETSSKDILTKDFKLHGHPDHLSEQKYVTAHTLNHSANYLAWRLSKKRKLENLQISDISTAEHDS